MIEINLPTPIEKFEFSGRGFFVKRDDMTHPLFSGNKARKLWFLFDRDLSRYKKLISYGSAQSNAMLSLSYLAKQKSLEFDYYVSHIASYLKQNPHGNYLYALENGMNLKVGELPKEFEETELFVHEGGYEKEAEVGIKILANEIEKWCKDEGRVVDLFLPSGTGTTALYLQKNLPNLKVYTTACVGGAEYLKEEFFGLCHDERLHPTILKPTKKYYFAKLYKELYKLWQELKISGIEFDLVYDPVGWKVVLEYHDRFENPLLYIHQGGILGNESMIRRHERFLAK